MVATESAYLSETERQALMLRVDGHSYQEIAERLDMTLEMTRKMVTRVRQKLSRAEAARRAGEQGLTA